MQRTMPVSQDHDLPPELLALQCEMATIARNDRLDFPKTIFDSPPTRFGIELKPDYAQATLTNLQRLWGRPVHIETLVDEKCQVMGFDGRGHLSYISILPV